MLSEPITEDRVANAASVIRSRGLKTPPGRPKAGADFLEAKAVASALDGPPDVVIAQYRRRAEEKPDDAQRQFLLGRVLQVSNRPEPARVPPDPARDLGYGPGIDRPLGALYVTLKQPDKATALLQTYMGTRPTDGWAHLQVRKGGAGQGD